MRGRRDFSILLEEIEGYEGWVVVLYARRWFAMLIGSFGLEDSLRLR